MNNIFTVTLNPAVDRELTVPEIKYDSVLRASDWRVDFGGKGFNVSRMLKSLGTDSLALGFAGGKSGEILKEGLESLGIKTEFVWVSGETRTNVSIVSEVDNHYIKANEPGPTITLSDQQALVDRITALCQSGDWWVLAGSLPPGVPPTYYQRLISIVNQSGACVVLDTSGEPLSHGCQAGPFLIKPNDYELEKLTGMPTKDTGQILAAAKSLDSLGVSNSLVSMGKHGALLITKEGSWMIKSPKIQERNPIGAGDSLVGGVVWGLAQNLPLVEAARWGVACGAAAASLSGTAVGSMELVKKLYAQTEVKHYIDD